MAMVTSATTDVPEGERQAFIEEATAFLEANAERRPTARRELRLGPRGR